MSDYKIKRVMLIFTDVSDIAAGVGLDYDPPPPGGVLPESVYDQPCVALASAVLSALEAQSQLVAQEAKLAAQAEDDGSPGTTIFPGMRPLK